MGGAATMMIVDDDDNVSNLSGGSTFSLRDSVSDICYSISSSLRGGEERSDAHYKAKQDRLRKGKEREEKEQQRRWEQFKKDEAFVMEVMNRELEKEQQLLEKKREKKAVVERKEIEKAMSAKEKAKKKASFRNQKRNQNIRKYLEQDGESCWAIQLVDELEEDCDSTAEMDDPEWEGQQSNSSLNDEETGYKKTIRWDDSVNEEQERRRIHRIEFPVKKGGMARRRRRNPERNPERRSSLDNSVASSTVSDTVPQDAFAAFEEESLDDYGSQEEQQNDSMMSNIEEEEGEEEDADDEAGEYEDETQGEGEF